MAARPGISSPSATWTSFSCVAARAYALLGPTASGKSRLALELAARLPLEIVSLDSAQVYRGMDIGTAKPSTEERARVPHHLIDLVDPGEAYSAGRWRADASRVVDEAPPPFALKAFALVPERAPLHARIAERFAAMLAAGLVDEVKSLKSRFTLHAGLPSMRAVGYRQVWEFLEGRFGEDELRSRGVAATRQLAKRQLTWLRGFRDVEAHSEPKILRHLLEQTWK